MDLDGILTDLLGGQTDLVAKQLVPVLAVITSLELPG